MSQDLQQTCPRPFVPTRTLDKLCNGRFMLRSADVKRESPVHSHRDDYYVFGIVISGQQSVSVDFKEITVRAQEALIISPGQVHGIAEDTPENGFIIAFAPEILSDSDIIQVEEYTLRTRPLALSPSDFDAIISLYRILMQISGLNPDAEFHIAAAIKDIILHRIPKKESTARNRYIRLVVALRKLLADKIGEEKKPSAYASMLNVSCVYLNEAIKSATGMTTSNYIISFALLRAKRDLIYSDLTVQEIALALGYDDYSYFSRLFRKHSGLSPREFRRKYLK